MRAFREAVGSHDLDAAEALLAEDVVFTSPVVFKPYHGKAITAAILRGAARVFEDFRYVREINDVGDREVDGCDFLHLDDNGLIDELTVTVRPLSGAQALAEAMGAQFGRIAKEAEARSA
ncbi:nuclear transport factor 2 family protein [Streptomyces sp. S.PNR 29]|uniref:nuclear transport factor 2 family protein n=1 Tax=Streptomyces sp. S.PNR 29 TaxID=2973805 RepID=UPI0025B22021|nr:nuclear transport factor 2 family protein [Streptomyces sp. S.PNR 29]MDN0199166.1 nuclear transport factor 2 family protein [Streptomyces sp. S.PNR 29]